MTDRVEKNRHHLVTLVALAVALAGAGVAVLVAPQVRPMVLVYVVAVVAFFAARTALVELGVRRRRSPAATAKGHQPPPMSHESEEIEKR